MSRKPYRVLLTLALLALSSALPALASSHREAPSILDMPQVDGADFYMFRSYESGRQGFVTLIADYYPMQDPFGAPNFFPLRDDAFYDIHIDNNGDAVEDLTFRFRFANALPNGGVGLGVPVPLGPVPGTFVPVAISNVFPVGPGSPPPGLPGVPPANQRINWIRTYTVRLLRGPAGAPAQVGNLSDTGNGSLRFPMPFDYIGTRSFPDYEAYAAQFVFDVDIPGCGTGRMFVGQRKDPFVVNLGDFFDLVHIPNPIGPPAAIQSSLERKNITSLELEVPIACLTGGGDGLIAGWTTASLPRVRTLIEEPTFEEPYIETGGWLQVSRLGNPLVNEISIALADKNLFNASHPSGDDQFQLYFTNPTVPVGIQLVTMLFPPPVGSVTPPTNIPRSDLVALYLNGLPGLNQDNSGGEVLRLNTAVAPTPAAAQSNLGVLGGDQAGWPNGRRPGDDVVDLTMRFLEGALCYQAFGLCTPADAPFGAAPFTDQSWVDATQFDDHFPYLRTPIPGSPQPARVFDAALASGDATASCAGLLPPQADPFAPPPAPTPLAITCTHDIAGAASAGIRQAGGGPVICTFASAASPIQETCPLTAAQLEALQRGQLEVFIGGASGSLN